MLCCCTPYPLRISANDLSFGCFQRAVSFPYGVPQYRQNTCYEKG